VSTRKARLGEPYIVVVVVLVVVVVVVGGTMVVVVGAVVVVVGAVDVVVVVVDTVDVVVGAVDEVVVLPQTNAPSGEPAPQESQQLAPAPTQAWPPLGGLHLSALDLVEHFTLPFRLMRQHVTNPSLPHVDLAAHLVTNPLQLLFASVAFAWSEAQRTNSPWFAAPAQSQFAATAARAAATSAASAPVGSHLASLRCAQSMTSDTASAPPNPEALLMAAPSRWLFPDA
jgi:hypothetical protein